MTKDDDNSLLAQRLALAIADPEKGMFEWKPRRVVVFSSFATR